MCEWSASPPISVKSWCVKDKRLDLIFHQKLLAFRLSGLVKGASFLNSLVTVIDTENYHGGSLHYLPTRLKAETIRRFDNSSALSRENRIQYLFFSACT